MIPCPGRSALYRLEKVPDEPGKDFKAHRKSFETLKNGNIPVMVRKFPCIMNMKNDAERKG